MSNNNNTHTMYGPTYIACGDDTQVWRASIAEDGTCTHCGQGVATPSATPAGEDTPAPLPVLASYGYQASTIEGAYEEAVRRYLDTAPRSPAYGRPIRMHVEPRYARTA